MKKRNSALLMGALGWGVVGGLPLEARACDLCAIFNDVSTEKPMSGTVRLALAEQFSYFGKVQADGHVVSEPMNQHMASSMTQFVGAYDLSGEFSLQASVPYINRRYKRFESGETETGTEAGIGDTTLIVRYAALDSRGADWTVVGTLFGGIKLPTGDSDRLGEESSEDHHGDEEADHVEMLHGGEDHGAEDSTANAVHGHDLALGSGSVDFPIGAAVLAHYERLFVNAELQYIFRTEGDFDYEYADDLSWSAAAGAYVLSKDATTLSFGVDLTGEYKPEDTAAGEEAGDTALRSVFLGPELRWSHDMWRGALAWDIPLDINNSGVQTVVTDRIRASVSYRF